MEKTRIEKYKKYRQEIERSILLNAGDTPNLPKIQEEDPNCVKTTLHVSVEEILKGIEKEEEKEKERPRKNKKEIIRNVIFFVLLIILIVLSVIVGIKAFG